MAKIVLDPYPLRSITRSLIGRLGLGTYEQRLTLGVVRRPYYGYCVYTAALFAKRLGYNRISALELGVAGGNGLVNLEYHAEQVKNSLSVDIDVYGFDTGVGLPESTDYRDLLYRWRGGYYRMDVAKLQSRLKTARLVLGDIRDTARSFFEDFDPAPIGAVMVDLDLYSSTVAALKIFDADERYSLPRVFCYFDDIVGNDEHLHNDYTGERLAINEFNEAHETKKFALPHYLLARKVVEPWYHAIRIYHHLDHSRYNDLISFGGQQLPLE